MIFYFSGTGNSYHAAREIAEAQGERLLSISKELDKSSDLLEYDVKEGETLGFVFPVYAWAPPKIVLDIVRKMKLTGAKPYVFSVSTCGEEEGNTTQMLCKALSKKAITLDSAFSIVMPSNYLVGIDVESQEVVDKKLKEAQVKLIEINGIIRNREVGVFQLIRGKMPTLKSTVVNAFFNRFALNTKYFYTTDQCNGCGLCELHCPVHTITVNGKPKWGKRCTQCFGCINTCPKRAIQYMKGTENKGRYQHPDIKSMHARKEI
ncbi:MAG: EFR1 family ferrodoxin [Bacillota bacterium]